jgi:hypothetical protein
VGILGGNLGTTVLFLTIGILLFVLVRRKASSDRMGQSPEIPVAGDVDKAHRGAVGGTLSQEEETVGGRLRYADVLGEDGLLQSDD